MLRHIIDRPIAVTMALLVVVVLGLVSIRLLPVSLIPEVDIPYISVQATDATLSAREMDRRVVTPLRAQLIQVGSLQDIVCEARDGSATLKLSFNHGADIGLLFVEVNEKIDRAMGSLPGIDRPRVVKAGATDIPAFFINVTMPSGGSFTELSRFCRDVVAKRIEQLPEVAMVDMSGTVEEQILVLPEADKLAQLGLTVSQLEAAIRNSNIQLGSLTIRDGMYRYSVKFDTKAGSPEDIADIWLRCGDRLLQIGDVAQVSRVPAKRTGLVRSKGHPAVSLAVIKQSDARMGELKDGIQALLGRFKADYPELDFQPTRDQTRLLAYSIKSLIENILLGILLACLVIFLFMRDFRSPWLVCLAMPSALLFSMLIFYLTGLSLNIISLSGLLLGVGMMADNTIILIDDITSRWQRSGDLRSSILEGTHEVRGPMLSSVLTTCAVFVPLVFVSGLAGALFFDEAMAVTIVLFTSYFITIIVVPVYYWWWYKGMPAFRAHPLLQRISMEERLREWDHRRMVWWLEHKKWSWLLLGVSVAGVMLCFARMPRERLPQLTRTEAILHLDWNGRISVEENERRTAALEAVLGEDAVEYTALVGTQDYVLGHSGDQGISEVQLYFKCKDMKTLETVQKRLDACLTATAPTATWRFHPAGNIFDLVFSDKQPPLTARLRPVRNPEIGLERLQASLEAVKLDMPDISIVPPATRTDVLFTAVAEKMALYGVSYEELATLLRQALNENRLFSLVQGNHTLPVVTGMDQESLSQMLSETFLEKDGRQIPAIELMRQTYTEDLKTLVSGTEGSYYPLDLQLSDAQIPPAMAGIRKALQKNGDFDVRFSGSWFSSRELLKELLWILLVAIVLLYLILASQFESLLQPVIILLELVIDLFGALVVLWTLGVSLNLMSLIGLVVVTGIVINDSILKIDTINRLRAGGMPLRKAVLTGSGRRMKAIIMTSLTTMLAVAPFLSRGSMGADLQYPLCLVILAGMFIGTLVSLFVVPAIYYAIYARKPQA